MEQLLDRYDFEAWQGFMIDQLKENYHLEEFDALNVLQLQKGLVNQLFDDFTKHQEKPLAEQLELLMDNDLEDDCWS